MQHLSAAMCLFLARVFAWRHGRARKRFCRDLVWISPRCHSWLLVSITATTVGYWCRSPIPLDRFLARPSTNKSRSVNNAVSQSTNSTECTARTSFMVPAPRILRIPRTLVFACHLRVSRCGCSNRYCKCRSNVVGRGSSLRLAASSLAASCDRSNVHWSRQLATASRLQWNSHVSQHALNSTSMSHAVQHDWPPLKEAVSWFS
jgi:hypothetical protein